MYRLLYFLMTVLFCTSSLSAQEIIKNEQEFKHSFQIDIILRTKLELSFQYEKKLPKDISILASIGFKKHKLPAYFSLPEYENPYIFEETSLVTWVLLVPIFTDSERYVSGTSPLDDIGNFVPESSIPLRFSVRKYFSVFKEKPLEGFWDFGMMANIHSGYTIQDKIEITDTQERIENTGNFFMGTTATITTTYFNQTRSITANKKTTVGMNVTLGIQGWVNEHVRLILAVEAGANIRNTNKNWAYYGIQPHYINVHGVISYSF